MKKLFDKDQTLFAVLWIVIYVVGFSLADGISESIGIPKLLTVAVGFVLSVILFLFIGKNQLFEYVGLCAFKGSIKSFLHFIPLIIASSVNLWNGIVLKDSVPAALLGVTSMCLVAFIEEVIFRGLLFKGMCRDNVKTAIIVSSLTFGMGHIVNLLLGAPLFDTLLQLVYASAVGFCYTAVFHVGKSIIPCIISHAVVNSLSVFACETSSAQTDIVTAVVQSIICIAYGAWLLGCSTKNEEIKA
ncbi:MAG: CPBP family intramembrane metalloprotease [Clostridia bacterium]|nr:CPBP family intramembrane metalloprotease [Clostridia bacterium]